LSALCRCFITKFVTEGTKSYADSYRHALNIRRLNLVFALSSVAMVAVCFWAVKQDYDKSWRPFQQSGRVWDAALTEERVCPP